MTRPLRTAGSLRLAAVGVIVLFSIGGYVFTSKRIQHDRRASAVRQAEADSLRTQVLLERAKAYVVGLGELLAHERRAGQQRFAFLAGAISASFGLVDALWVRSRANPLVATYATTIRPGESLSRWPALLALLGDRPVVFAVTATNLASFAGEKGFFLLESADYAPGSGYLAVFVPQGWVTLSLGEDPRRFVLTLDGKRLEGALKGAPAATAAFDALGQSWRTAVALPPESGLQSTLPWIALGWPAAVAFLVLLVGGAILQRKKAERAIERIFDLSPDLLCVCGTDGLLKRVNPAFERTLRYSAAELLTKPFLAFVHPADRDATQTAFEKLAQGGQVIQFENRHIRKDGSVCWLEWSSRPVPRERLIYGAARDVTERRELVGQLRDLVDEQSALRRVATLVARGVPDEELFAAVTVEMRQLLDAQSAGLMRYEPDGTAIVLAGDHEVDLDIPVGTRLTLDGGSASAQVKRTGRPARVSDLSAAEGPTAHMLRRLGLRSIAGAPIVVEGSMWGVISVGWRDERGLLPEVETRMSQFTELVATAIANAYNRAELAASRARLVAAADESRRRIERDLHDGAQQRLVALVLMLRAMSAEVPAELAPLQEQLADAEVALGDALAELQELSRGIHPAILSKGGLEPALRALARGAGLAVELNVTAPERLPERVEVAAYYLVSEALANAAKHARPTVVRIRVDATPSVLEVEVRDDGIGGADPRGGSGLVGLRDRVEAIGGTLDIVSERGTGTSVRAMIPIRVRRQPERVSAQLVEQSG